MMSKFLRLGAIDAALDCGTCCDSLVAEEVYERVKARKGVVLPGEAEEAVKHGTLKLLRPINGEDGHTFKQFYEWVDMWIDTYKLDVIAVEAPLIAGINMTRTNPQTVEVLFGLYTVAKTVAARRGIQFFRAHRQTVMVHFLGRGNGFAKKRQVIEGCNARGLYPADDNAADAIALFDYMAHCFKRPLAPVSALFREKVTL